MPKQSRKPADPSVDAVAQFGYDLRALRQKAKLSYAKLAQNSFYSVGAVHRADQGHVLPSAVLTCSFVTACGEDSEPWVQRRNAIAAALEAEKPAAVPKPTQQSLGVDPPDPTEVTDAAEFNEALKRLREWAGMSFRQMQAIGITYARTLPASTVCAALQRGCLLPRDLVESYVRAIGLAEPARLVWMQVWDALNEGRPVPREPAWKRWRTNGNRLIRSATTSQPPAQPASTTEAPAQLVPAEAVLDAVVRDWVYVDGEWCSTEEPKKERHFTRRLKNVWNRVRGR